MTTWLSLPYALAHTTPELAATVSSEEHLAYNHSWLPHHWTARCWIRSAEVYTVGKFVPGSCYVEMSVVGIPVG